MSAMLELAIEGIGVCAPGMDNWQAAREVLAGRCEYTQMAFTRPTPALLAPNERRRAPDCVLLALSIAEQATTMAQRAAQSLPNAFASSYGDLSINDYLCAVLARAPAELSPTKFHNSVHNAPAGYWTIASGCMASSTALSAGQASFAACLLEAATFAASENTAVLCAAFDVPAAGPLAQVIACDVPFGVAFVLAPVSTLAAPRLRLSLREDAAPGLAPLPASLHALRERNPAAASLPLLMALARGESGSFDFALQEDFNRPALALHAGVCI